MIKEVGKQVKNGKAFEFALANQYALYLIDHGVNASLISNKASRIAKRCYDECSEEEKQHFDIAARKTIETLVKLEPGLTLQRVPQDHLSIVMSSDLEGQEGDVRDVVFSREKPQWEVGFSAKNNHEAVKHSRLSMNIDFGQIWLGHSVSDVYREDIKPIFTYLQELRILGRNWSKIGNKEDDVYVPILKAFRNELLRINASYQDTPKKLIKYIIGRYPFYKIIKDDAHNMVVVKAFNLEGLLNQTIAGQKSAYKLPKINYPTRIVEFDFKPNSKTTLNMILDNGWEISFRIHSASTKVETSLKFDIQLLGNPPILFTQHLFQE